MWKIFVATSILHWRLWCKQDRGGRRVGRGHSLQGWLRDYSTVLLSRGNHSQITCNNDSTYYLFIINYVISYPLTTLLQLGSRLPWAFVPRGGGGVGIIPPRPSSSSFCANHRAIKTAERTDSPPIEGSGRG